MQVFWNVYLFKPLGTLFVFTLVHLWFLAQNLHPADAAILFMLPFPLDCKPVQNENDESTPTGE